MLEIYFWFWATLGFGCFVCFLSFQSVAILVPLFFKMMKREANIIYRPCFLGSNENSAIAENLLRLQERETFAARCVADVAWWIL